MMTMNIEHMSCRQRWHKALWALAASLAAQPALAVNDLPGGPAVNQLNLHPPVTQDRRRHAVRCTTSC